jgi:pyridoxamine 5'-phosphate oxidase
MGDKRDLGLDEESLSTDPMTQFRLWYDDADAEGIHLVNAIALATAGRGGVPGVRHVLLRHFDADGFVFFTNYESDKGKDLEGNPRAAFTVLWRELDRQITVSGEIERTSAAESDAYFAQRPREAQIGTWASPQSHVLRSREELTERFGTAEERFEGDDVPRPEHWGGYRLSPSSVEFWQARAFRLHDRLRYSRNVDGGGWQIERLAP